jgi:acetyl-CoA carboxylase biotin carboxyl carrier protein
MASFDIDDDLIRRLAGLLQETGLTEIEFSEGDRRVRVTRTVVQQAAVAAPAPPHHTLPAAVEGPRPQGASPEGAVTSPMVGTAYLAPEPGASPYVKVGDRIEEGQTILIIEAMKVMNPIRAPRPGVVRQVVVADAQPVEFGEVLMIID